MENEKLRGFVYEIHDGECGEFVTLENGFEYRLTRPQTMTIAMMKQILERGANDVIVRGEGPTLVVKVLRVKDTDLDRVWLAAKSKRLSDSREVRIIDEPDFNTFVYNAKVNLQCDMDRPMVAREINPAPHLRMEIPVYVNPDVQISVFHLLAIQQQHVKKCDLRIELRPNDANDDQMCVVCVWSKETMGAPKRRRIG